MECRLWVLQQKLIVLQRVSTVLITPVTSMDKSPWHCTCTGQDAAQWVLMSSSIHKILRALMHIGMPIRPWWANNHDVAHLQAKTVLMNLIWSESAHGFWHLQASRSPDRQTDKQTDRRMETIPSPPFFLWKGLGTKKCILRRYNPVV